jgi:kumamolisin
VISTSWGLCEPFLGTSNANAENTLFQEAAVQGQSVFAASGDSGAQDCLPAKRNATAPAVDDPASQPFVTGVGGTKLTLSPTRSESVWNNGPGGFGATGGGDSAFWPMPSYQTGAAAPLGVINGNSSTACGGYCRQVPDVAFDADPNTGLVIDWLGSWASIGGTSAGAPSWAAITALANASSSCGGSAVGFANPLLYSAASNAYATTFNDVVSGNNDLLGTNGGVYSAKPGYDQATGLGTPQGVPLASALCPVRLAAPAAQRSLAGAATQLQLQATSSTASRLAYAAAGLPPGLTLNPQTGVISGAPTTPGTYTVTIVAADTRGASSRIQFTWVIVPATLSVPSPGTQTSHARASAVLRLHATDNNGAAITYSAHGLPRGLKLTGGVVSGTPTSAGTFSVTVTASAVGAPPASVSFKWRIIAAPSVSRASLSGGTLTLSLQAGSGAARLSGLTVNLPRGLSISGVTVTGTRGFRASTHGRRTVITFHSASRSAFVSISVRGSAGRKPVVQLTFRDASRFSTTLRVTV